MDNTRAPLGRWYMGETEAAAALAQLGLDRAAQEARQDAACLRGLAKLTEQPLPPTVPAGRTGKNSWDLRRLYGRSLQLQREYEAHADDPEYGRVFALLAQHKARRCVTLLSWLGGR